MCLFSCKSILVSCLFKYRFTIVRTDVLFINLTYLGVVKKNENKNHVGNYFDHLTCNISSDK